VPVATQRETHRDVEERDRERHRERLTSRVEEEPLEDNEPPRQLPLAFCLLGLHLGQNLFQMLHIYTQDILSI
jgi:hypothetical protein